MTKKEELADVKEILQEKQINQANIIVFLISFQYILIDSWMGRFPFSNNHPNCVERHLNKSAILNVILLVKSAFTFWKMFPNISVIQSLCLKLHALSEL